VIRQPPPLATEKAARVLAEHRDAVGNDKRDVIDVAVKLLRKAGVAINVSTAACRRKCPAKPWPARKR
jgi:hypothetical protein